MLIRLKSQPIFSEVLIPKTEWLELYHLILQQKFQVFLVNVKFSRLQFFLPPYICQSVFNPIQSWLYYAS